jgi:hypothetical protein
VALGYRFVDPTREPLADHLELDGEIVRGRTPAGEYMINEINLNSQVHRERRRERGRQWELWKTLQQAITSAVEANQRGELQKEADEILQLLCAEAEPWDALEACFCKYVKRS